VSNKGKGKILVDPLDEEREKARQEKENGIRLPTTTNGKTYHHRPEKVAQKIISILSNTPDLLLKLLDYITPFRLFHILQSQVKLTSE